MKEHLSVIASKYSICDMKIKTYEFTLCSTFKHSPNGKDMFYGPKGYGIMASMEYILIIYSTNGEGMVLWNIVFPSGNCHGKRQKKDAL